MIRPSCGRLAFSSPIAGIGSMLAGALLVADMAAPGAVPEVGDGQPFVWPRLEVVGMTGCTIGLEAGRRPWNLLAVPSVTVRATDAATMVARIVRRGVTEGSPIPPRGRCVTLIALQRGPEVIAGLAGRRLAIVTTGASAGDVAVVERCGQPRDRPVTGVALCRSLHVIVRLAGRRLTVVTARAIA